ncbi:MAG: universal stress protein [Flammeovirgaceae bacterium]
MRKIFVPTDFSTCAENALKAAANIARKAKAEVFLFHTLDIPMEWEKVPVSEESRYPETRQRVLFARQRLKDWAEKEFLKDITVNTGLYFNKGISEIVSVAKTQATDLIVMGTRGASTLTNWILGSNTQRVIRLAKSPVLTINEYCTDFSINRLVFASSFEEKNGLMPTVDVIMELEALFNVDVHLLKVKGPHDSSEFDAGIMEELVKRNFAKKSTIDIDSYETVDEGIFRYAESVDADLIVIATHGRTGLSRFFMGNLSEVVVNYSPIPVMVTHFEQTGMYGSVEPQPDLGEGATNLSFTR